MQPPEDQSYGQPQHPQQPHYQQQPPLPYVSQQPVFQPPQKPPKKKLPWWGWLLIIVGVIALCGGINNAIGSNNSSSNSASTTTTSQTTTNSNNTTTSQAPTPTPTADITKLPAYRMASIDEQSATPDAATIAKYQKVLDSLHNKTGESEQQIADETVAGQEILQKDGYTGDIRLLTLMNAVDSAITKKEHVKYNEALAALITIMENGK